MCDCTEQPLHLVMLDRGRVVDRLVTTDFDALREQAANTEHERYLLICPGCGSTLVDTDLLEGG